MKKIIYILSFLMSGTLFASENLALEYHMRETLGKTDTQHMEEFVRAVDSNSDYQVKQAFKKVRKISDIGDEGVIDRIETYYHRQHQKTHRVSPRNPSFLDPITQAINKDKPHSLRALTDLGFKPPRRHLSEKEKRALSQAQ